MTGSCKIKISYFLILKGNNQGTIKVKEKQTSNSIVWSSVSDFLEPEIYWFPKGLSYSMSSSRTSTAHADCLRSSESLSAILAVVLGSHSITLGSLKCCNLHYNWAAPSPISISWAFFSNSVPEHGVKPQPLSVTPSCLLDKYHLGNLYPQPSTIDTALSLSRL